MPTHSATRVAEAVPGEDAPSTTIETVVTVDDLGHFERIVWTERLEYERPHEGDTLRRQFECVRESLRGGYRTIEKTVAHERPESSGMVYLHREMPEAFVERIQRTRRWAQEDEASSANRVSEAEPPYLSAPPADTRLAAYEVRKHDGPDWFPSSLARLNVYTDDQSLASMQVEWAEFCDGTEDTYLEYASEAIYRPESGQWDLWWVAYTPAPHDEWVSAEHTLSTDELNDQAKDALSLALRLFAERDPLPEGVAQTLSAVCARI